MQELNLLKAKLAELKKEKQLCKTQADGIKIQINGTFGKLGEKYSIMYDPQLMLQVTLTGQLLLLMLIERMELANIQVISANTDGIILKYNKQHHELVRNIITKWEQDTNFVTEETKYKATYARDVNSYIAIKEDVNLDSKFLDEQLGCKTKGAYCERGSALNSLLSKNPKYQICVDAVLQKLVNGIELEQTIYNSQDIKRFVCVRNVKGGAQKNGQYLGKVVRWYYAKNEAGYIAYANSGNKVAETDRAKPLMRLPTVMPDNIDRQWYVKRAKEMLSEVGYENKELSLF